MNGVIIWSEHVSKRAIIWCEDHGRLAFFKAEETLQGELSRKNQVFAYESGDMVSFTVDEQADLRLARDLQWVSRQKYPHLAEQLKAGSSSVAAVARPSGNIVQFKESRYRCTPNQSTTSTTYIQLSIIAPRRDIQIPIKRANCKP